MKLAVMQPYFFPYLGYFDLIHAVDRFMVFDTAQYPRRGWVARNRVLHPQQGWQYLGVPLRKATRDTAIARMQIFYEADWRKRIVNQLEHYHSRAPYFGQTMAIVSDCLEHEYERIVELNLSTLRKVSDLLGLEAEFSLLSELDFGKGIERDATDTILEVCKCTNATHYFNLPGGESLYDAERFAQQGIRLDFRHLPPLEYATPGYRFEPGLSIIDVLMWNSPEAVKAHLDQHREAQHDPSTGGSP